MSYNPCSKEFQDEARRLGLTGNQYIQKLRIEGKLPDISKIDREYREELSIDNGFENFNEYQKEIRMNGPLKRSRDFEGRKCHICGGDNTTIKWNGKPHWRTNRNKDREWDRKYHLCSDCYRKYDPESLENLIKSMRLSRIGDLERESENGKSVIGQWMTAKVLELTDNNIEKNNFREKVDLSKHHILGKVEVKSPSLIEGKWHAYIGMEHNFDSITVTCMDNNNPWKNANRVYIIPESELYGETQITIYEDWPKISRRSKFEWIEKYRIDEKPFNDIYHSADIPKFFSPFDLWKGKYDKRIN
jgi:hypothetical protein